MRIAFSGSHRVGKSSLLERVAEALPRYTAVDEPYYLLEEAGHEFSHPPALEDFVAQLERSLDALEEGGQDVLFDRCPADLFAYLLCHDEDFAADEWLERTRAAMQTLDLVVFVPIEDPDRIALPRHEDRENRRAVNDRLRELLVDDELRFAAEVLEVGGDVGKRFGQVMARIAT